MKNVKDIIHRGLLVAVFAIIIVFYVLVFKPVPVTELILYDVNQARTAAAQADRPILMFFTASWCGPCVAMKNESWSDPAIEELLRKTVVPVFVDIDEEAGKQWKTQYGVGSLPTMIITNPQGKVLQWHTGYQNKSELTSLLESFVGGVESHLD